ncbi:hypothetical protein GQ43DRAFT_363257 [Delitschia confertaspora ATCC 74209]|uniref:Uncharacterized protein n=1 Tax=Delitschia confertaspora ATCC 74209 TaxID=1513339 RepID=A0A9P4MVU7_9PLEO|nr:hypothetical protein GQ43DRAFT_363257 [Delitschia confertaspora ATCC 74209]
MEGSSGSSSRLMLPGFGLPLDTLPKWERSTEKQPRFPHAIADNFETSGVTVRERRMLDFINQITDKPEWDRKVFDETIVAKWKREAVIYDATLKDFYLSEKMFEFCIAELREKSDRFRETGCVEVLDIEASIVKSDVAISSELRDALARAVWPLEHVPDIKKDWHPGSDEKVLDLVHPSLFPLIYGVSRVVPTGSVPLNDCVEYSGKGETATLDNPPGPYGWHDSWNGYSTKIDKAWGRFQWLPANIHFRKDNTVHITSYINNLEPSSNAPLYTVLEECVHAAIPLWNQTLSSFHSRIRIPVASTGADDWKMKPGVRWHRPGTGGEEDRQTADNVDAKDWDWFQDKTWAYQHGIHDEFMAWLNDNRTLIQREPEPFTSRHQKLKDPGAHPVDLRQNYKDTGLQIIFKLANIHLTPEKPAYDGGTWHVEGTLNEHICATALYYYDAENVTDSYLGFRQTISGEKLVMRPEQYQYESAEAYFGVKDEGSLVMQIGQVLTRPNRLLVFPNVLQHKVQPFRLLDPSKPGYRKILAMFLVDPHIPILSTANVPPQRIDWWAEKLRHTVRRFADLPQELWVMIIGYVRDEFPLQWDEAVGFREELMEQRRYVERQVNEGMEGRSFSFCEH